MAVKIEHRTGVQAPAAVIWEILSDLPAWSEWNPIYPKAAGQIRYGERLQLTLALPGEAHRQINPAILDWTPNEAIHWQLSAMGGLVTTVRYLEIETLSPTGCAFSNGEIFSGLLGGLVARQLRRPIRRGFTALGEALRDRAEALWRERSGGAT
ncbi:MAG: SRPBCC domain-containing protein [Caulobacteraceae bacterium]|nr:SRPBCC domain-containing protein [Caulobacteraceae bacterium]